MALEIKTDNKWKEMKHSFEVPESVLEDYDWLDEDEKSHGWVQYRDRWYHSSDFMRVSPNSPFPKKWHGYYMDSFFSGVLIEISDCGDGYRIGTYFS